MLWGHAGALLGQHETAAGPVKEQWAAEALEQRIEEAAANGDPEAIAWQLYWVACTKPESPVHLILRQLGQAAALRSLQRVLTMQGDPRRFQRVALQLSRPHMVQQLPLVPSLELHMTRWCALSQEARAANERAIPAKTSGPGQAAAAVAVLRSAWDFYAPVDLAIRVLRVLPSLASTTQVSNYSHARLSHVGTPCALGIGEQLDPLSLTCESYVLTGSCTIWTLGGCCYQSAGRQHHQ